jgi:hypothetical protein
VRGWQRSVRFKRLQDTLGHQRQKPFDDWCRQSHESARINQAVCPGWRDRLEVGSELLEKRMAAAQLETQKYLRDGGQAGFLARATLVASIPTKLETV